jgi:hypothetical protein
VQAKLFNEGFCNLWASMSAINVPNDGAPRVGLNALLHITFLGRNFSITETWLSSPTLRNYTIWPLLISFSFENENTATWELFSECPWNSGTIAHREHEIKKKKVSSICISINGRDSGLVSWTRNINLKEAATITKLKRISRYSCSPRTAVYSFVCKFFMFYLFFHC